LRHFRKFWAPQIFNRSIAKGEGIRKCADLLNEKTIEILKTHQSKLLPEDMRKELKKSRGRLVKAGRVERISEEIVGFFD